MKKLPESATKQMLNSCEQGIVTGSESVNEVMPNIQSGKTIIVMSVVPAFPVVTQLCSRDSAEAAISLALVV